MARTPQDVTDAELTILQYLWDQGEATTRQLTDVIHPEGTASHYATALNRVALIGRRLRAMAEKLCGGSLTPLLTHLLKVERLSPRERDQLRAFMDELDAKSRPKGRDT